MIMKRDSFGEEVRTAVTPDDNFANECPDDLRGSGENQQTTGVLSLAGSDESRTNILLNQAHAGEVNMDNPYIHIDLARHYDDPNVARAAVLLVRYDLLGRGKLSKAEKFLRRALSPTIRSSIRSGVIEK
jgi:hypothetical protein